MCTSRLSLELPEWITNELFEPAINKTYHITITDEKKSPKKLQLTKNAVLADGSKGACIYCKHNFCKEPGLITIDHLIPQDIFKKLRESGEEISPTGNYKGNLVAACISCNLLKNNWPINHVDNWASWIKTVSRENYIKKAEEFVVKKRTDSSDSALNEILMKYINESAC